MVKNVPMLFGVVMAVLLPSASAFANPIAITQDIYIAEERLIVLLSEEQADIECRLLIRSVPNQDGFSRGASAGMFLPVWFPKDFKRKEIERLDELVRSGRGSVQAEARKGFLSLSSVTYTVNGSAGDVSHGFLQRREQNDGFLPSEAFSKSFQCVLYHLEIPAKDCRKGARISIKWHQPVSMLHGDARQFFYLPIIPTYGKLLSLEEHGNSHIAEIRCNERVSVAFGWGSDTTKIGPNQTVILPLKHLVAIKLAVSPVQSLHKN
jgi:hypothetical protein